MFFEYFTCPLVGNGFLKVYNAARFNLIHPSQNGNCIFIKYSAMATLQFVFNNFTTCYYIVIYLLVSGVVVFINVP